jgi:hypothetical protein
LTEVLAIYDWWRVGRGIDHAAMDAESDRQYPDENSLGFDPMDFMGNPEQYAGHPDLDK